MIGAPFVDDLTLRRFLRCYPALFLSRPVTRCAVDIRANLPSLREPAERRRLGSTAEVPLRSYDKFLPIAAVICG